MISVALLISSCNDSQSKSPIDSHDYIESTKSSTDIESFTNNESVETTPPLVPVDMKALRQEYYVNKFEYTLDEHSMAHLNLPKSNGRANISLSEEVIEHLSLIDKNLFDSAIDSIFRQVKNSDGIATSYPTLSINIDEDNYISMCLKWIVHYDPPRTRVNKDGTVESAGCGIDHDHIQIWYTRISNSKIK